MGFRSGVLVWFRIWGLGFRVGLGFGVWGHDFGVSNWGFGLGFGVWGHDLGFRIGVLDWGFGLGFWFGLGFGVWGLGFRV